MRFAPQRLRRRLDRLPLLRALIPFAAGILLAEHYLLPAGLLIAAVVVSGALAALFRSSAAVIVLLLSAGFGTARLHHPPRRLLQGVPLRWELRIDGLPAARRSATSVEAVVERWCDPATAQWHRANDRVLLYVDSALTLRPGERIGCSGRLRDFRRDTTSYRMLMLRRGYAGTLWLGPQNLLMQRPAASASLHVRAVERLARLELSDRAAALVRTMAAGDRSGLTADLRNRFARSGLSHLLAVSGLHTAIVFGWVTLLFGWLVLLRNGNRFYHLLCGGAVWLFVWAAGFPPSAVRAAILCTLMQGALFAGRAYDALNALAAAAFVMLLWSPAWIGDISFQLSFASVFFLLVWGVPLQRRLRTHRRIPDLLAGAWIVSLVAGAATAPLVAHTFGTVPLVGLLLNPVALLPAALLVLCGTLWMLLPLPLLAPWTGGAIENAAAALDGMAGWVAGLPHGTLAWRPDAATTGAIYLGMVVLTCVAGMIERRSKR